MLGETAVAPPNGFPSNETKEAFCQAAFAVECDLPPPPAELNGTTIVDPEVALGRFRATGSGTGADPLVVIGMRLDGGIFTTDRGQRELPAWALRFRHVEGEVKVIALSDEHLFAPPPGANLWPPLGVIGTEDATEVRVHFTAGPPARQAFDAITVEDDTGVAVILRMVRDDRVAGIQAAVGHRQETTVGLSRPIGHRVVIDGRTGALTALHA